MINYSKNGLVWNVEIKATFYNGLIRRSELYFMLVKRVNCNLSRYFSDFACPMLSAWVRLGHG